MENQEFTANQTPIEVMLKVDEDGTVSAKKVYAFLELHPAHFAKWCRNNIVENEFAEENVDFTMLTLECEHVFGGAKASTDYKLSISFAKKLCMVSKSDRGEQARDYFLKVEDELRKVKQCAVLEDNSIHTAILKSREIQLAEALLIAGDMLKEKDEIIEEQKKIIEQQQPHVDFSKAIQESNDTIEIGEFAKVLRRQNVDVGRNRLFEWLRENEYLMDDNIPYQKYINLGFFEIVERHNCWDGIYLVTIITGAGQKYLWKKIKNAFAICQYPESNLIALSEFKENDQQVI